MDLLLLKFILLLLMILLTCVAGLVPVKVLKYLRRSAAHASSSKQHKHVSLILCLLTCFSGGVFLATCFLHLFPELIETWNMFKEDYDIGIHYPVAELLSCAGFFLLFFLEEVVIMALPSFAHIPGGHGHSHGHGHGHSHGSTSTNGAANSSSAGDSVPLMDKGGCCMTVPFSVVSEVVAPLPEKLVEVDHVDRLLETGSVLSEGDGHCQTHCPLTVHRRRHSVEKECTAVTPELFTAIALAEPERCETNCEKVDEDPPILMKSSPHAHSHGVRSLTLVMALSFHSIIEGLALGVAGSPTEATTLFLSLMVHKLIVAFSVGLQLARTHAHALHWVVLSIFALSVMSPLGALIGMGVQNTMDGYWKDLLITVFQGLAVGTFIYVTFFEVLLHERDNEHPNMLKLLFILIGFCLIGLLRLFDDHNHDHGGHGHSHEHEGEEELMEQIVNSTIGTLVG